MDTFNPNQMPPQFAVEKKSSVGPLIAVIIILALIVIGGLYFLNERASQTPYVPPTEQSDAVTESLNQQGESDELNSIESDLNATDLDSIDEGAAEIEAELQ